MRRTPSSWLLTQVLKVSKPVATRDEKKRDLRLYYHLDTEKALQGPESLADSIVAVDENRTLRSDFGRKVDLDLSSTEKEIAAFHFPCGQILDSSKWEYALVKAAPDKFVRFITSARVCSTRSAVTCSLSPA